MTRFHLTTLLAVAALSGSSVLALAQVNPGSSSIRALNNPPSTMTGRSATTVPRPAADPNSQVAPSTVGLPGGATSVPLSAGAGVGQAVPFYGASDASGPGLAGSIDESSTRSSSTDCSGTGTRSSTGSGSTSATTSNCSSNTLGTRSIMGGSGAVDVSGN
jgi:hypothetical protein